MIKNSRGAVAAARRLSQSPLSHTPRRSLSAAAAVELPSEVDVVVIGGGSVGASTLYHLQQRGIQAILLEKDDLTSGTTWHSAGMLWRLRPSDIDIELHTYTREMCIKLEEETEVASWTENGGLFIAGNDERFAEYKRLAETGRYFGIESTVLAPGEVQDVHPLVATDDIVGALYSPTDGTIDPTGIVTAYSKAARKLGARVFEKTPVEALDLQEVGTSSGAGGGAGPVRRVTGVIAGGGQRIKCGAVVNACGAWANDVAAMAGASLPLLAMKHAFVVTEAIEGMHPGLPNVRDHDLSVYMKTQGDAMAIGGYEQNPEFWDDVDPGFAFGLFELDWDTFAQNLDGHCRRVPAIAEAGIKSTVCGPESFTPDHKPLLGPQPGVRGMFNACGFNSMGMMLGGGVGREMAAWIDQGSPDLDLFSFDCSRFHPDTTSDGKWVKDRTHESYAKTYAIVFPHDEALAGRGARTSALHEKLESEGCVHQARHGFERPGWFLKQQQGEGEAEGKEQGEKAQVPLAYDYYGAYDEEGAWRLGAAEGSPHPSSIPAHEDGMHLYHSLIDGECTFGWPSSLDAVAEECRAAREGVAIFDQSYFGKFLLSGKDARLAVDLLCSADATGKGSVGAVTYTTMCNEKGGVEADLTVTALGAGGAGGGDGESFYFAAGGNTATKDLEWMRRNVERLGLDARVDDHSASLAMISVQGPRSRELVHALMERAGTAGEEATAEVTNPVVAASGSLPLLASPSASELSFSTAARVRLGKAAREALCLRLTFVGELGFELHVPSEHAAEVYAELRAIGRAMEEKHGFPVRDAGYRAIDSLSAEKNYRHWHADLSNRDTPMEAGIGFTALPRLKKLKAAAEADACANGNGDGNASADASTAPVAFIGAEALQEKRAAGLQRKLVCLVLDDPGVLLHGAETLWRNGRCVGVVRSAAFGHTIGRSIAYGYVDLACNDYENVGDDAESPPAKITNKWLSAGTWEVGDKGARHAAELSLKAPFDPSGKRVDGEYDEDEGGVGEEAAA